MKTLKLRPAQIKAYEWLQDRLEAALFMGCGLGKTSTCLLLISRMLLRGETIGVLVIAPRRVCNLVWPFEILKWKQLSWLRVANLRTEEGWDLLMKERAHLYVINYEQLAKLEDRYFFNRRQKDWAFDTVIFDELTKTKNTKSKRIRAVRRYLDKLDRRWGLTGTPTPNGLLDLFGQIRTLDGGARLGKSITVFKDKYFKLRPGSRYAWIPKSKATKQEIYHKISDLAITLKTSDYADTQDAEYFDVEVSLPTAARKHYKELAKELYILLQNKDVTAVNKAVLTNKLLQVTSGAIYPDEDDPTESRDVIQIHEAKIKAIKALVKSLKEPVILVYGFKHERDRLCKAFPNHVRFDRAKTEAAETKIQNDWNDGLIKVLIAHPASIGHGLNLQHGGRTVIWMSPTWDRELYDQMNARVERTGQREVPQIYHILTPETMDDCVLTALEGKDTEQNTLLDALKKFAMLY